MTLTVTRTTIDQIQGDFISLYTSVFGDYSNDGNCPYHVYLLKEDAKSIGFASGFSIGLQTWYLQRAGFTQDQQKRVTNLYRANFAINHILKEWPYIMTFVHNEDASALHMILALGFKIIGVRMDTAKKLWVELLKEKDNG
jgi:hypothetical protein